MNRLRQTELTTEVVWIICFIYLNAYLYAHRFWFKLLLKSYYTSLENLLCWPKRLFLVISHFFLLFKFRILENKYHCFAPWTISIIPFLDYKLDANNPKHSINTTSFGLKTLTKYVSNAALDQSNKMKNCNQLMKRLFAHLRI